MTKRETRILENFFGSIDRSLTKETHFANFKRDARSYKLSVEAITYGVVTIEYLYTCGGTLSAAMSVWS